MIKKLISIILSVFAVVTGYCQTDDRWYILSLGDKPAGYYHEQSEMLEQNDQAVIRSGSGFKISLSRLGSQVDMQFTMVQTEDKTGRLKSVYSEMLFSKQKSQVTANIKEDKIEITTSTGGKESYQEIKNTDPLTGAEGIRLLSVQGLNKPEDSIVYETFDPEFNMVLTGVRRFVHRENIEFGGKPISVTKVVENFRAMPIRRELWLDRNGRIVKTSEPNPYGQLTFVLSNKYTSMKAASAKVELSDDTYAATMVRSNVRLPQSRQIQSITIRIKLKNKAEGFPDLSGPYQEVIEKKPDYVVLKIRSPKIGESTGPLDSNYKSQYLVANSFLDKDDTLIVSTAKQIVDGETDPYRKAILVRNWVTRNMKFSPGIVLAPSSEVIRNREGTCASYATLTATLCRAAGIPSRYLMGYVYMDGIWAGHAWVQIYIDNSWIPIDAAVPSPGGIADAARFCYVQSSMNNGPGECLIGGQQLYSNVDVEILSFTLNDKQIKPGPKVCEVTNKEYDNGGLGISMKRVKNFEFDDLNKVFPENILFSMRGKNSEESVRVYQYSLTPGLDLTAEIRACFKDDSVEGSPVEASYNGRSCFKLTDGTRSAVAIVNGSDVYVIVARGKNSEALLEESVKSFRFMEYPSIKS